MSLDSYALENKFITIYGMIIGWVCFLKEITYLRNILYLNDELIWGIVNLSLQQNLLIFLNLHFL